MADTATASSPSRTRAPARAKKAGAKRASKTRAEPMMPKSGAASAGYLKQAAGRVSEASSQLVKWGKDHPVKAAAAGAALLAVTSAIYATMRVRKARATRGARR